MRRRSLNIFVALSAVVCFAITVMWVRSHWYGDQFVAEPGSADGYQRVAIISSVDGRIEIEWNIREDGNADPARIAHGASPLDSRLRADSERNFKQDIASLGGYRLFDFGYSHGMPPSRIDEMSDPVPYDAYIFYLPYWFAFVLSAFPPALWFKRTRRRQQRLGAGLCAKCGYDLRATPDRCPECGTVPPKHA